MPRTLAIQVDAQCLFPHQVDDPTFLYLGVTIQTAFEEGFTGAASDFLLLNPWRWTMQNPPSFDVYFFQNSGTPSGSGKLLANVAAMMPSTAGTDETDAVNALEAREVKMFAGSDPSPFLWDPLNPNAVPPAQGHVLSLLGTTGRLSGPLSALLNLTAVLKISLLDIANLGADFVTGGVLAPSVQILVAPRFKSNNQLITYTPQATGPKRPTDTGLQGLFRWSYDVTPGATDQVNAYGAQVDLTTGDSPNRFIQLSTNWVLPSTFFAADGTAQLPDPGVDWHTQLAEKVAAAWDTPRLLLDATRDCVSVPHFDAYCQMLLAALRDRASLGVIETPDGMSLLEYAIRLSVTAPATTVDKWLLEGQLTSLVAKLRVLDAGFLIKDWVTLLVGDSTAPQPSSPSPLLPELVGKLSASLTAPSSQVTLTWPATNTTGITAATQAQQMFLVQYSRLDEPPTPVPGPGQLKLTPAVAGQPDLDRYSTKLLPNGDFAVVISPENCSPVLTAGWYEAVPDPHADDSVRSTRVFVPPGIPDDVAPVARALAELNQDSTLADLLNRQWSALAALNPLAGLATGAQSHGWFTSIETHLPVLPAQPATTELLPEILVSDGRFWVTTLAGITLGADNDSYALEFRNGSLFSSNLTQPGDTAIAVQITPGTTAGNRKLDISVTLLQSGAPATALASGTVTGVSNPYHLRLELHRDIQTPAPPAPAPPPAPPAPPPPPQQVLRLSVFIGQGLEGSVQWQTPMVPPAGAQPATPIVAVAPLAGLERLGLVIRNDLNSSTSLATQAPPTLLPARASLMDSSQVTLQKAWDGSFDQGKALWNQVAASVQTRLPGMSLRQRLAFAQTSRLWPIWNDLTHGQGDFALGMQQRFRDQFTQIFDQRFNFSGTRAAGIYSDFFPDFTFPSDPTALPLWNHLKQFLSDRADQLAQSQPLVPAMSAVSIPPGSTTPFAVEQAADQYPTKVPHAMNLQVDTEHTVESNLPIGGDDDLLRRISGYGVMIRQASADSTPHFSTPWALLNFVDLHSVSPSATPSNPFPASVSQSVPAPVPLQHQNSARQTTLSFNNRAFLARSPLNAIGESYLKPDPTPPVLGSFQYQVRTVPSGNDWGNYPSLKFGQLFQVIPFVMGNCCSLPKLLAPQHPVQLRTDSPTDPQIIAANAPIRQMKYLRRVDVGQPRRADPPAASGGSAPGLPSVPPFVRSLSQECGLSALTYSQPQVRFFYDESKRVGLLQGPENWAFVIPRVTVAGRTAEPDGASGNPISFTLSIGLAWFDSTGNEQTFGLVIARNSATLQATCNTATATANLVVPGSNPIQPLQNGPLDLRVLRTLNAFWVSWRRADRDEPWQDFSQPLTASPPNTPGASWIVVQRTDAPATHQSNTSEAAITYGTPTFSQNTVPAGGAPAVSLDNDLGLRAIDPPRRTQTVLDPYGKQTQVALNIRPPSTDLETWDRWFAMDAYLDVGSNPPPPRPWSVPPAPTVLADFRKSVWKEYYDGTLTRPKNAPGPDTTIDDPAVDLLVIELVPLLVEASKTVVRKTVRLDKRASGQSGLAFMQYPAIPFQIVVQRSNAAQASGFLPPVAGDPPGLVKIAVTEQEIWELRVYPAVRNDWFTSTSNPGRQRFHSRFSQGAIFAENVTQPGNMTQYRLSDPWCAVLEVATREVLIKYPATDLDVSDALLRAIQPSFVSGRTVQVAFQKQDPRVYRYMSNLRLSRQVWRWQGRPEPPFPFWDTEPDPAGFPAQDDASNADLDSPPTAMSWDAVGFGDRSTIDMFDETRHIDAANPQAILFNEDLSNDLRALYYRFTGEAQSRYAPLYPANPPVVASFITSAQNANNHNAWQRLIVPCRRTEQLPRPAVRLVVPLTESEDDMTSGVVPGLLVVLDEPWFAVGGLSEQLEAEVVQCSDYYFPTPQTPSNPPPPIPPPHIRPEFGPDPVLRGIGWTQAGSSDPPDSSLAMDIVGPIGHTFDTSAESPLFNASSFVLRPPRVIPPNGDPDLAWYFAKVRFRRALLSEGLIGYVPGQKQTANFSETFQPALDPSSDWVIDIAQIICPLSLTNATVTLGSLGSLQLVVDANQLTIKWQPAAAPQPTAIQPLLSANPSWAQATIDLRFVLQLDAVANADATAPPRHLTVEYRLREVGWAAGIAPSDQVPVVPLRTWRILDVETYTDTTWPANVAITQQGLTSFGAPTTALARVSPFTSPYWVQFLPDAQLLQLPPTFSSGRYGIQWRPNAGTKTSFYLAQFSDDTQLWVKLTKAWHDNQVWPDDPGSPNFHPPQENSQVLFQRRVLITSLISDVRGQLGQERYVGLYRYVASSANAAEVDCFLQEVHRSPAFDVKDAKPSPRLRARVIEFQTVGGTTVAAAGLDDDSIWDDLFATTADDSGSRIVRVSPPLELVPVTVTT